MNAPLTAVEWLIMASIAVAAIGLLAAYYGWRTRHHVPEFRTLTVHGPDVPEDLERVFGPYGSGGIEGLIVLQEGVRVGYKSGFTLMFMPVPDGGSLFVNAEGGFEVIPPALGG